MYIIMLLDAVVVT